MPVKEDPTVANYTIKLSDDLERLLDQLAKAKQQTKSEIIRRAVASYSFLNEQAGPESVNKLSITDASDRVVKDVVLP
jgi:hypothetical protein